MWLTPRFKWGIWFLAWGLVGCQHRPPPAEPLDAAEQAWSLSQPGESWSAQQQALEAWRDSDVPPRGLIPAPHGRFFPATTFEPRPAEPYEVRAFRLQRPVIGEASWYGPGFHGRLTASGERFDQHQLTAAHRTLPLPSFLRVTHRANGRQVLVRVNDRGPYHGNRIIDLSAGAARALGITGVATVALEVVEGLGPVGRLRAGKPLSEPVDAWSVVIGDYALVEEADRTLTELLTWLPPDLLTHVEQTPGPVIRYHVQVGPMLSEVQARQLLQQLRAQRLSLEAPSPTSANPVVVADTTPASTTAPAAPHDAD